MRTNWLPRQVFEFLLRGLSAENRLILTICERHGCRVGDVLRLRPVDIVKKRWSYREQKTGKRRVVTLSMAEREACARISGRVWVFEHRLDPMRHRTRQAVWKGIQKAAKYAGFKGVGTHTARKVYAVELRNRGLSEATIQKRLNHTDSMVTMLYAYADVQTQKNNKKALDKFTRL